MDQERTLYVLLNNEGFNFGGSTDFIVLVQGTPNTLAHVEHALAGNLKAATCFHADLD